MGDYSFKLMEGVYATGHTENDLPTRDEVAAERARQLDMMNPPTAPSKGVATMSGITDEQALRRQATSTSEQLLASQSALAETKADRYSALAGTAAGLAAVPLTGGMGSGPAALAGRTAVQLGTSALGAGLGKRAGYELPGKYVNMEDYESPEGAGFKWEQSVKASADDALLNVGMLGLGMGWRGAKVVGGGVSKAVTNKFFGLTRPEIVKEAEEARKYAGLRLVPLDVSGSLARTYAKVVAIVPVLGQRFHQFQGVRDAEARTTLKGLVGPSESGLAFMSTGKNFIATANNAWKARKNWYDFLFKDADLYADANPHIRVNNDAIDAAREYIYEQSRRGIKTAETTTSKYTTERVAKSQAEGVGTATTEKTNLLTGDVTDTSTKTVAARIGEKVTTGEVETTRRSIGEVRNFSTTNDVDTFINDVANSEEVLTIPQYRGLSENINLALGKAEGVPAQERFLVQMRENLDSALERTGDEAYTRRLQQARATYKGVMEFFENPQAQIFVKASPEGFATRVKALNEGRPSFATVMPSEIADKLTRDLTPEGVENLRNIVGVTNMEKLTNYYMEGKFNKHVQFLPDGSNKVNWDGLRAEFGIGGISTLSETTKKFLEAGNYKVNFNELETTIDLLEKYSGNNIKFAPLSTMLARSTALGGMKSAGRNVFATGLVTGAATVGGKAVAVGMLLAGRKLSKFLTDPTRLKVLKTALQERDTYGDELTGNVFRPLPKMSVATSQVIRYLASDLATEKSEGRRPTEKEIDITYENLRAEFESMTKPKEQVPENPLENLMDLMRQPQ